LGGGFVIFASNNSGYTFSPAREHVGKQITHKIARQFMTRLFTAIVHKEDTLSVAECPEVGTASQGYTIEEALENLKEATEVYLEEFVETGENR